MLPQPKTKGNPATKATFFKDGNKDMVRIDIIGDPCAPVTKVTAELVAEYPAEWEAYQNGQDLPTPVGTPLTEIPGFTKQLETFYKMHGIFVCEQLVEANDMVCQKLGMGARAFRKSADNLIKAAAYEKQNQNRTAQFAPKLEEASAAKAKKAKE